MNKHVFTTCLGDEALGVEDPVQVELMKLIEYADHVEEVEIEAKLGLFEFYRFENQEGKELIDSCFESEFILDNDHVKKFSSGIPKEMFLRIHKILDDVCEKEKVTEEEKASEEVDMHHAPVRRECMQIRKRVVVRSRDDFYEVNNDQNRGGNSRKKRQKRACNRECVRVSVDEETGEQTSVIQKQRIRNLQLRSATRPGARDIRISLNNEKPNPYVPNTATDTRVFFRRKRRTKYFFDAWVIDLTTVENPPIYPGSKAEPSYEVEVEILPDLINSRQMNDQFSDYIAAFLHTVRVLSQITVDCTDESFLLALQALPIREEKSILNAQKPWTPSDCTSDAYKTKVGDVAPLIGHYYDYAAKENILKEPPGVDDDAM